MKHLSQIFSFSLAALTLVVITTACGAPSSDRGPANDGRGGQENVDFTAGVLSGHPWCLTYADDQNDQYQQRYAFGTNNVVTFSLYTMTDSKRGSLAAPATEGTYSLSGNALTMFLGGETYSTTTRFVTRDPATSKERLYITSEGSEDAYDPCL